MGWELTHPQLCVLRKHERQLEMTRRLEDYLWPGENWQETKFLTRSVVEEEKLHLRYSIS